MDELIRRIRGMRNPSVIGLDTRLEHLPQDFLRDQIPGARTPASVSRALFAFNRALIDALADIVPGVKVQAACYELYGPPGMRAFAKTLAYARKRGLSVIADVKRNDIGSTAEAYADAYLGCAALDGRVYRAFAADFATVTPYLGEDSVAPFVAACAAHGRGAFVLVKTSNPSSGQLQDLLVEGRPLYERVGDLVARWGAQCIGQEGYSAVGAVVGATYPAQAAALRARMPHTFFLVPGYGAQGATGADLAVCFDGRGGGAVINASRSVLCAWQKRPGVPFAQAARQEALRMRDEIASALASAGKALR
ncbi:MAG: orotidine-5'-phosphate decarboxylase [Oscillospiraceae bacterium]|jgi:orotidine-5'-phosphate decarboxylase|nr:orotidine-5'-phosphate decarboxylase [Oscillospiraceae bacterium]